MRAKVKNASHEDVIMKTSERGRLFTIKFHKDAKTNWEDYSGSSYEWGHLNVRQAKTLIKELKMYIKRTEDYNKWIKKMYK